MREYLRNRLKFPLHQLAQHTGEWVAWSPDGLRIVASSTSLADLDNLIREAGEDPEQCPVEGIPDTDSVIEGLNCP